jgi:hypothetical protein
MEKRNGLVPTAPFELVLVISLGWEKLWVPMISTHGVNVQGRGFAIARQVSVNVLRVTMALHVKDRFVQMIAMGEASVGPSVCWLAKLIECTRLLGIPQKKWVVFVILAIEDPLVWSKNAHQVWTLSLDMATRLDGIAQAVEFAITRRELAIASFPSLGQDANTKQRSANDIWR